MPEIIIVSNAVEGTFRGPGWRKPPRAGRKQREALQKRCSDEEHQTKRARRKVLKESASGGIRRNTGLCQRRKEYGAGRGRKEDLRTERGERSAKALVSL